MIDVEPLIGRSFERIFPAPSAAPDWDDVVRRAGGGRRPRRPRAVFALAFAALLAAAIAVSPLGATIARSISDFSGWLQGSPGKPASSSAQRAFERGNAKSWAAFPRGTKLRELIKTSADGVDYTLFGFRSGESLCLRIYAQGVARGSTTSCAPLRELRARPEPVLVMEVDYTIGTLPGKQAQVGPDRYNRPRASVSFGIVSDGVKAVRLRSDHGVRDALVDSDSFLFVNSRPPAGDRVHGVAAKLVDGRLVTIPFAEAPFDMYQGVASHGTLHGPSRLDRVVKNGMVGWLIRHEPRGTPWVRTGGNPMFPGARLLFGRMIQPDPQNRVRIGISLWNVTRTQMPSMKTGRYLCSSLIVGAGTSGGCTPPDEIFKRSPVNFGLITYGGGNQYSILYGVATDEVVRLRLYLGTSEVVRVPLRDNVFAMQLSRAKYPFRLVGYDRDGKVIANDARRSEGGPSGPAYRPAKNARWRKVAGVTAATGRRSELWAVPSQAGGVCWRLRFPGGGSSGGCVPPRRKDAIRGDGIPSGGPDPVLLADVRPVVTRVVIVYRSGTAETVKPVEGFVLYAVPKARVDRADHIASITAYDRSGSKIGEVKVPRH